ncbi:MAG: SusC/RagA family TonB-linked outer membrane protein [Gemmatimonadaceae bacterium]
MRNVGWTRAAWQSAALLAVLLSAPRRLHAQGGSVAGTVVVSGSQRGLSGAQISVDGQPGHGAVTDASGRFRIGGITGGQVMLQARLLGFRPDSQSVRVGATDVRFVMSERALELNEIVVTGTAGGEQRRAIGTSIASVDVADVMAKTAVPSVDALLNGRAPGVVVLPGTGQIGSGAQIRIRGISSFSLSSNPLIYVDGVRVDNQTGTGINVQSFSSGIISRMNDFDPEEIESIEVLKGPAAATLYGTEAARGVINIITKKGASGATKYSFTMKQGSNWFMDAANRLPTNYCNSFTNSACSLHPGDTTLYSVNVYQSENARGTPLFRDGGVHNYAANVSGGSPLFRFFASGEWNDNQGVDFANERIQQSARTNLSVTPNDKFDLESSVGYVKSHTTLSCEAGCGGTMWGSLYSNPANTSQFCVGSTDPACGWGRGFNSSPPESDRSEQFWQDLNRFTGSVTLRYNPWSWFTNRLSIGTDYTLEDDVDFLPYITNDTIAYFWGSSFDGFRYQNHHQAFYNTYDYSASANANVRPTLTSKTSGGIQYYTNYNTFFNAEGDHFPAPGLETITAAGTKIPANSNNTRNNTLGFYLQQEFGWRDQLFVTGAARVDNNSAFGNDIKWVTYPKASLSWVASENESVKRLLPSFINNLRLRGAYGGSGQQPAYNTALRTLAPVAGPNNQATLTPSTFGNLNLKPERVFGTELGFESGLFNDRFGIDFTYYNDVSRDAILSRGVAPSTGFGASTQYFNAGEIQKSGIELGLKAQLIERRTYSWESNFNISTNNGKIKRLNGKDTTIDNGSYSHRVGYAPYSWFSYRVLSATYDPALRKAINPICDNGNGGSMPCYNAAGVVQAPKVYLGRGIPPVDGSWTNSIRFLNNFRVYVMTDFATDYERLDNNLRIRCQIFHTCLQYVQPANTDPRLLVQMQSNGVLRDFVINNASYAKLREVSISYDVPERFSSRFSAHGVTLTASGRNLHTWSPYTGLDPEMQFLSGANPGSNFGVDQAEYPPLASFVFTIRANY